MKNSREPKSTRNGVESQCDMKVPLKSDHDKNQPGIGTEYDGDECHDMEREPKDFHWSLYSPATLARYQYDVTRQQPNATLRPERNVSWPAWPCLSVRWCDKECLIHAMHDASLYYLAWLSRVQHAEVSCTEKPGIVCERWQP